MQYKSNKGFTGWGQFGMLLLFTGIGMFLGSIVQVVMSLSIIPDGTPFEKMGDAILIAMKNPENVGLLRWIQFVSTIFMFMLPAVTYSFVTNGKEMIWMGFSRYISIYQIILGFLIIFTAGLLGGPLQDISQRMLAHFPSFDALAQRMENLYNDQIQAMGHLNSTTDFMLALVIMAFLPAVFEELFFRATMQTLFVKWWKKPLLAIIVTSLIFSLVHASIYLFFTRALLGFALGLMYHHTKNIWVNVVAHFMNNAIATAQLYVLSQKHVKIAPENMDMKVDGWMGIIALVVLVFLFNILKKYSEVNKMRIYTREQSLMAHYESGHPFA